MEALPPRCWENLTSCLSVWATGRNNWLSLLTSDLQVLFSLHDKECSLKLMLVCESQCSVSQREFTCYIGCVCVRMVRQGYLCKCKMRRVAWVGLQHPSYRISRSSSTPAQQVSLQKRHPCEAAIRILLWWFLLSGRSTRLSLEQLLYWCSW